MNQFPYAIYDAHHHFWDLDAVDYPWLATKGVKRFFGDPAPIQKNYLPDNLRIDFGKLPVEKSVHIQVGAADEQHLLESQVIQGLADSSGLANGIVGYCALEQKNRSRMLDQLCKLDNFRGVRQIVGRSPEEDKQTGTDGLLNSSAWLEGLVELEERKLSFDLQLIPDQMSRAAEVFSNVPELAVALCHCGSPWYRDSPGWEMWRSGLYELAALPNMHCKISGLSMFDHNWSVETLRPIVETVIEIFGPERCMLGSNFPVDKLHTNYHRLWLAYLEILDTLRISEEPLTTQQKQRLFKHNCAAFYKLG